MLLVLLLHFMHLAFQHCCASGGLGCLLPAASSIVTISRQDVFAPTPLAAIASMMSTTCRASTFRASLYSIASCISVNKPRVRARNVVFCVGGCNAPVAAAAGTAGPRRARRWSTELGTVWPASFFVAHPPDCPPPCCLCSRLLGGRRARYRRPLADFPGEKRVTVACAFVCVCVRQVTIAYCCRLRPPAPLSPFFFILSLVPQFQVSVRACASSLSPLSLPFPFPLCLRFFSFRKEK